MKVHRINVLKCILLHTTLILHMVAYIMYLYVVNMCLQLVTTHVW